jgi:uncharacterized membrane-anchored protein
MKRQLAFNILFLAGLSLEVIGQLILTKGNEFVYQQRPIDFAHWFLLLGAALLIPQVISFPSKVFTYLGAPLALVGIVCIIGMCVLDFVWWSLPDQESRNELAGHLSQEPSIWKPFITTGTGFLNYGLILLALNHLKDNLLGVVLVILATLIIFRAVPMPYRLVVGYTLTLLGFARIFYFKARNGQAPGR